MCITLEVAIFFCPMLLICFKSENKKVGWIKTPRKFMANDKEVWVRIILKYTNYVRNGVNKESMGMSKYITQKNWYHTLNLLELRNPYCYKHTLNGEI